MKKSSFVLRKIQQVLSLLTFLLVLASCVSDDLVPNSSTHNEQAGLDSQVTFMVDISGSATTPLSRAAMSDSEENSLNEIYILAFNSSQSAAGGESTLQFVKSLLKEDLNRDDKEINKYTFRVGLPKGKYDFIVLANLGTLKSRPTDTQYLRDRLDELISMPKDDVVDELVIYNSSQNWKSIPMSGMAKNVTVDGISKEPVNISIIKSLVRVDVEVASDVNSDTQLGNDDSESLFKNFSLESITIFNYNYDGYVTPDLNENGDFDLNEVHIPNPVQTALESRVSVLRYKTVQNGFANYFRPDKITNLVYFNEIDVKPYELSNVSSHPCIVIGARFEWEGFKSEAEFGDNVAVLPGGGLEDQDYSMSYYRIDFERINAQGELEPVQCLRNRNFKIKITKVNREGYKTAFEALRAGPDSSPMLEYELVEEDLSDLGGIVFDGRNFLAVSPNGATYGKEESVQMITLTSDYDSAVKPELELLEYNIKTGDLDPFSETWAEIINPNEPLACDETILNGKIAYKYYVKMHFERNPYRLHRQVYLSVKMGKLVKIIEIVQTDIEQMYICVEKKVEDRWIKIDKLDFLQEGYGNSPTEQQIRVRWSPATAALSVTDFSAIGGEDITKYTDIKWDITDGCDDPMSMDFGREGVKELTLRPTPLDVEPGSLITGLQQLVFAVDDDFGRAEMMTLQVKQDLRALFIDAPDFLIMNGDTHQLVIRANTHWKLTIEQNGTDQDLLDLLGFDHTAYGVVTRINDQFADESFEMSGNRLNQESYRKTVTFITRNDLRNPSVYSGELKLKLQATNGSASFEKSIKCVSAIRQDGREANCYVLDPTSGVGLLIPVRAANRQILDANRYLAKTSVPFPEDIIGENEILDAKLIWSDVPSSNGVDTGNVGLLKSIKVVGQGPNAYVLVMPNSDSPQNGNSLVAVTDFFNENIFWSWHIWSLTNIEFEGEKMNSYIKPINTSVGAWLDRDLGARSAVPGTSDNYGYFYQWGRKDPTPSPADQAGAERILYNDKGEIRATTGSGSVTLVNGALNTGFAATMYEALQHPLVFYMGNSRNTRWLADNSNDIWYSNGKTIYDPCPAGYRVPAYNSNSAWFKAINWHPWESNPAGVYWVDKRVFYPASGYRGGYDWNSPTAIINEVNRVGYRQTALSETNTSAKTIHFSKRTKPGGYYGQPDKPKILGFPVRCVKMN